MVAIIDEMKCIVCVLTREILELSQMQRSSQQRTGPDSSINLSINLQKDGARIESSQGLLVFLYYASTYVCLTSLFHCEFLGIVEVLKDLQEICEI